MPLTGSSGDGKAHRAVVVGEEGRMFQSQYRDFVRRVGFAYVSSLFKQYRYE
ncbi:hypothetical protein DPMN_003434 [Dreissena polymorpha]|uniref:Uncharacterized protein n=1 Tax=Dreissena polymorpha TaxID=45954 RepID=A0A9D4MNE9_DREPO|nr:hypothetical protein DPMN_003434 [Dreissena polymorpha]